jgi:Protein of unknown function (DUF1579)
MNHLLTEPNVSEPDLDARLTLPEGRRFADGWHRYARIIFAAAFVGGVSHVLTAESACLLSDGGRMPQAGPQAGALNQPAMVRNGQPGEMHKRLGALVGEWNVNMTFYIAGGTTEKPIVASGLICRREWIPETGNRHLRDVMEGTFGGNSYYRLGILSYSTMDKRYEWNTVDVINTMMMTYKGAKDSASPNGDIVMSGEFTDQGVLGDSYAGKTIGQRTVIKIESPDRHVFDVYFTPPGETERLAARWIYTRRK